jgi:hypothetical protein
MGERRGAYRVLVGKPEGRRPLGRPRRRWEDNIKMDLREVWCGGADWVNLAGVTLDKRLTWSSHIDQVKKKVCQRLGVLGPLLDRRSGPSIRNGVLLFRQLIRPMMDYACPDWRSAARCHIRKLQMLQSKCRRIVLVHLGT